MQPGCVATSGSWARRAGCVRMPARPTNSSSLGPIFRTQSGTYLDACLPFKVGWTAWHLLFLRHFPGAAYDRDYVGRGQSEPTFDDPFPRAPRVPRFMAHPRACAVLQIILVRNPYERMLSYYLDKVQHSCLHRTRCSTSSKPGNKASYWPKGLKRGASFADTLRAVARSALPEGRLEHAQLSHKWFAALHYAPISLMHSRCMRTAGAGGSRRVLKVEYMDEWYGDLVRELGLQQTVASGWGGRGEEQCFHVLRRHGSCAATNRTLTACHADGSGAQRTATAAVAVVAAARSGGGDAAGGGAQADPQRLLQHRQRHNRGTRSLMSKYYTPELARLVSSYAKSDIEAFKYPRWDGDPMKPFF